MPFVCSALKSIDDERDWKAEDIYNKFKIPETLDY